MTKFKFQEAPDAYIKLMLNYSFNMFNELILQSLIM